MHTAKPYHRVQLTIQMTDIVHRAPLVIHPKEMCVTAPEALSVDMINIRAFRTQDRMTFDMEHPQRGSLHVDTDDKGICNEISLFYLEAL